MTVYARGITMSMYLSMGATLFLSAQKTTLMIESTKTMSKKNNATTWQATLRNGKAITLSSQRTTLFAPEFAALNEEAWTIAKAAYVPVEMQFLKAFPQVVGALPYFTQFEDFFKNGIQNVDWQAAEAIMATILKGHFIFDPTQFGQAMIDAYGKDTAYFIAARDAQGTMLGFATFLQRANYPYGTIKVMSLAVDQAHQNKGIGKLLVASIFKAEPNITKLFLCTRVTNTQALGAYKKWGFVPDATPIMDHAFDLAHWSFLTYDPAASSVLQDCLKK